MPRWSPENTGATTPASRPLTTGEVFEGSNRRDRARWHTECVVTAAEPGHRFALDVRRVGPRPPVLRGRSGLGRTFAAVEDGTRVTATWTDGRTGWPNWTAGLFDKVVTGGRLFPDFQRSNIARTLATMKADRERPPAA